MLSVTLVGPAFTDHVQGGFLISDAQLILGYSRRLTAYAVSDVHAELETLRFAGQVYEMAWRLRNAQVSSAERVRAIGIEAKIGRCSAVPSPISSANASSSATSRSRKACQNRHVQLRCTRKRPHGQRCS